MAPSGNARSSRSTGGRPGVGRVLNRGENRGDRLLLPPRFSRRWTTRSDMRERLSVRAADHAVTPRRSVACQRHTYGLTAGWTRSAATAAALQEGWSGCPINDCVSSYGEPTPWGASSGAGIGHPGGLGCARWSGPYSPGRELGSRPLLVPVRRRTTAPHADREPRCTTSPIARLPPSSASRASPASGAVEPWTCSRTRHCSRRHAGSRLPALARQTPQVRFITMGVGLIVSLPPVAWQILAPRSAGPCELAGSAGSPTSSAASFLLLIGGLVSSSSCSSGVPANGASRTRARHPELKTRSPPQAHLDTLAAPRPPGEAARDSRRCARTGPSTPPSQRAQRRHVNGPAVVDPAPHLARLAGCI